MIKRHTISFFHAFQGLHWAIVTQPNFRVHLVISILVFIAGLALKISSYEWLILFLCITIGLSLELVNTSIEAVTDLVTTEHRQFAKIAKDTAAAAMLVFAMGASILAAAIFIPKL
jgi:diacylglycerol kinase